jgi:hypothetical protein
MTNWIEMFDHIPVVIFDLIHGYLSHYDYRQLMNCNLSVFASVKYETVYHDFKMLRYSDDSRFTSYGKKFTRIQEIIDKDVKSRKCQIGVKLYWWSVKHLKDYRYWFSGLNSLSIFCGKEMALNQFSLVCDLHLYQIRNNSLEGLAGLSETEGTSYVLSSIRNLELYSCSNLIAISEIERLPNLKKVSILLCNSLRDVSCLRNVEDVTVSNCKFIINPFCLTGPNQKSLSVDVGNRFLDLDVIYSVSLLAKYCHLTSFSFQSDYCKWDFSGFCNDSKDCHIRCLKICSCSHIYSDTYALVPQLLYLKSLDLAGFDLSHWNQPSQVLSSVRLSYCMLPLDLMCFKYIRELALLSDCQLTTLDLSGVFCRLRILSIRCFYCLKTLILDSITYVKISCCSSLFSISNILEPRTLSLQQCDSLFVIEGLLKADYVELICLPKLEDFSFLKLSRKLLVQHCPFFDEMK